MGGPIFVTGETEEEFNAVKQAACGQFAFYASTPAYKGVLDSIGYGDLQPELNRLSKAGEWAEMGRRIDDAPLDKLAIVGDLTQVREKLSSRYGDVFDLCTASIFTGEGYSEGRFHQGISEAIKSAGA